MLRGNECCPVFLFLFFFFKIADEESTNINLDALATQYTKLVVGDLMSHYVDATGSVQPSAHTEAGPEHKRQVPLQLSPAGPYIDVHSPRFQEKITLAKLLNGQFHVSFFF